MQVLEERWGSVPESSKDLLRTQHEALREQAREIGLDLPSFGDLSSPQVKRDHLQLSLLGRDSTSL